VSAVALAETPLAGPTTAIWNASNSFFAAEIVPATSVLAAASGRIFSVAVAVQTVVARAAGGSASARASARMTRRELGKDRLLSGWVFVPRTDRQASLFPPTEG